MRQQALQNICYKLKTITWGSSGIWTWDLSQGWSDLHLHLHLFKDNNIYYKTSTAWITMKSFKCFSSDSMCQLHVSREYGHSFCVYTQRLVSSSSLIRYASVASCEVSTAPACIRWNACSLWMISHTNLRKGIFGISISIVFWYF